MDAIDNVVICEYMVKGFIYFNLSPDVNMRNRVKTPVDDDEPSGYVVSRSCSSRFFKSRP